jgi:hypothetical protein
VQADVYGQMTALRYALVDDYEGPGRSWMLSHSTLAIIRNATTSGVVMFDPDNDTILWTAVRDQAAKASCCAVPRWGIGNETVQSGI